MDDFSLLKESWPGILGKLKNDYEIGAVSYNSWIAPLTPTGVEDGRVILAVPRESAMLINYIDRKYAMLIRVAIEEVTGAAYEVSFISEDETRAMETKKSTLESALERANLNPRYSFNSFVVGSNNNFASAASLAVAETPGEIYNPLYLYSDSGLGKTHLMQSICRFILEQDPTAKVLYVTSETFTNELIEAIRLKKTQEFRDKYRNLDVLAIDDIQFIIGKGSTQEEIFHTFNTLSTARKQIIISSDKPPKDLNILEDRIMSRLEMGLIADISAPNYETRMAILRRKEELEGFRIDDEILHYIAANAKSNIRQLEGCVNRINAAKKLEKREITLEMAESLLRDTLSPEKERQITPEMILDVVGEHFHMPPEDLRSPKRNVRYAYPRKLAMYLCRDMTSVSLLDVARLLNRKDHTTVINAIRSVEREMEVSEEMRKDINALRQKLNSSV